MSEKMSTNEQNVDEKAGLREQAAAIDIEAQPLPKQSCNCSRKALDASLTVRAYILTFLAAMLGMCIMGVIIVTAAAATLYGDSLPGREFLISPTQSNRKSCSSWRRRAFRPMLWVIMLREALCMLVV
jgi:hypothetical protein